MLKLVSLSLLLGMGLMLAGCSNAENQADQSKATIRVQLNWFPEPEFGGLYEAKRRGLFKKAGLVVELLKGGPDVPAPQMIASGRVEFGMVSGPQLLTLRSQGGALTGIFSTFQKYPRGIVVPADSPYSSLEELWKSSATVMGQDGLAFIKWLNMQYGGKDLSFVPYGGSLAPLIAGKVDAMQCFVTSEPVQLKADGFANRVFLLADSGYDPYVAVIAVNDTVLKERPEMVSAFVGALREGWRTYLESPGKTNELLRTLNPDMKPEVLEGASEVLPGFVESEVTKTHGVGWMTEQRWKELADQLVKLGELPEGDLEKAGRVFLNPPAPKSSGASSD